MAADISQFFTDLVRFETRLWNAVESRLAADCGLTIGRYDVLRVLGASSPCRVNDIAEELEITWGGTSKLVDRLEAAALCTRRPNPDDGRSSLIELTPSGKRMLKKARNVVESELHRRLDGALTVQGFDRFAHSVTRLRTSANEWSRNQATA